MIKKWLKLVHFDQNKNKFDQKVRSGLNGFKFNDVFFSDIISETNFPVAGPRLQPIMA